MFIVIRDMFSFSHIIPVNRGFSIENDQVARIQAQAFEVIVQLFFTIIKEK